MYIFVYNVMYVQIFFLINVAQYDTQPYIFVLYLYRAIS